MTVIELSSPTLPDPDTMYAASVNRDAAFEGVFFMAVRTTGIFCRPTCHARKPKRENVAFFGTAAEALAHGYRPCRVCNPMEPYGAAPVWVRRALQAASEAPGRAPTDEQLRTLGIDPARLRRWFNAHHGMTFRAYLRMLRINAAAVAGAHPLLEQLGRELGEYFAGTRRTFAVPLAPRGTPFQESAWTALRTIPYGETRSYADQARAIGRPRAVRAVGRANGENRIAIVIPCHRVVGADGKLTGYGGGVWRKRYLLDLERTAPGGAAR